jgi:hypothetical protein
LKQEDNQCSLLLNADQGSCVAGSRYDLSSPEHNLVRKSTALVMVLSMVEDLCTCLWFWDNSIFLLRMQ